jgi:LacI family transcriptional regulator
LPPTQKEIALKLGVSQGLVSQILNGKWPARSPVHRHILQECKKLGYLPNHAASVLRTGRRKAWGLLFPSFTHLADFNRQIIQGIWETAYQNKHTLSVTCLQTPDPDTTEYMRLIREGRFDGVFMVYESEATQIPFEEIHRLGVTTVVANCPLPHQQTHCVYSDGEDGVYQAVKHLIEVHGRRKIAYVYRVKESWLTENRYAGYVRALTEFGIPIDEQLIFQEDKRFNYEQNGALAVKSFHERRIDFDAVYCPVDYIAFGAIGALQDFNKKMPDQVAVIGFDNHHLSDTCRPKLTTVHCDGVAMGRKAGEIMLDVLRNEEDQSTRRYKMPVSLVVRQSCGCGGVGD